MCIILRFLLAISFTPAVVLAANLASSNTTTFEVVGLDNRSVSYVSELAEHVATHNRQYLLDQNVEFPQRIFIALRPVDKVDFEGNYKIFLGDQGSVRLDFRWDDSLSLQQTCSAISEAFLTRYAIYQYGPSAPAKMRAWPVQALGLEAYLRLRPALLVDMLKQSNVSNPVSAEVILQAMIDDPVDVNFQHHAYYFLGAVRSAVDRRSIVQQIVERALAGSDTTERISKQVLPSDPTQDQVTLAMWWQAQRAEIVAVNYSLHETMQESRAWLSQMIQFAPGLSDAEEPLNLRSLWKLRTDPKITPILEARLELIQLRLQIVNPLYFNTARSLGVLYEMALAADTPSHRYLHALVIYLGDIEDAKRIEEITDELLDKSELSE